MTFPHGNDTLISTYGYHPNTQDVVQLSGLVQVGRMLVVGSEAPDTFDSVGTLNFVPASSVLLPRGIYWFATVTGVDVMVILDGDAPSSSAVQSVSEVTEGEALHSARSWMAALWEDSAPVERPAFAVLEEVMTATGEVTTVRSRRFSSGTWLYEVRADGRIKYLTQKHLSEPPSLDDPSNWVHEKPAPADRFAATLTRAKLEGNLSDTMFSFRATRTLFRPYQFKPVMKLLQTGKSRLLIADEVGLGKTIEAGLIWTELEARHSADRVLIVCPSSLVAKWRREMTERFNFEVTELDSAQLDEFEERAATGRLPKRGFYIGSLELLRRWEAIADLARLRVQFDLVIVDEAHYMRNIGTRSHALGGVLSEMADNLVFLTATPLNLRSADLYNLVDLLSPGEFGDQWTFEEQLEPNAVLHRLSETLSDRQIASAERLAMLDELNGMAFGPALANRPEMRLLRQLLQEGELTPELIVRARRLLADLNAMSTTITRTRKVEVEEDKAVRRPHLVSVTWSPLEASFYEHYLQWCKDRAEAAQAPLGFAMQMPLRLASACLPAARDLVLSWGDSNEPRDEDEPQPQRSRSASVPPSPELVAAAEALGECDTKYEELERQVRSLVAEGKRTLLFTFSRPTLDYLRKRLAQHARVAVLHGGVDKKRRHEIIADFRAGGYDVVLANRVASEGLDFEFCSTIINYDLPWNPMEVEQRIGRIDRMGQQETVISVINFYNEETIDNAILMKVMSRIGVFERSIGALEPIIMTRLNDLQAAMFDFDLSPAEREYKTNQVLEAVEGESAGLAELSNAASFLLVADDVDVKGMEGELLRTGRYVGQDELVRLINDWAQTCGAAPARLSADRQSLVLRGNAAMAQQLRGLVSAGRRTTAEVEDFIAQLSGELEINLVLDQELARTSGGSLLTANHPLVLAALAVPGFQQARFASIRVPSSEDVEPGHYLVQLAIAGWGGLRPGSAIWGVAVSPDGTQAPNAVVERLLSSLAAGEVSEGQATNAPLNADALVASALDILGRRQVLEEMHQAEETQALLEARRISMTLQHERKLDSIRARMRTARERGKTRALPLFAAQQDAADKRYEALMTELEASSLTSLDITPLAVCRLEVVDAQS